MARRSITNRRAGSCAVCKTSVPAGGGVATSPIAGRGQWRLTCTEHAAAASPEPSFVKHDRAAYRAGITVVRNGSGQVVMTRNARGRCEDAPCCGCCS